MTSPPALHSSEDAEAYTGPTYVLAIRHALRRITLDPFSCVLANTVVRADMIYTIQDDGYAQPWGDIAEPQKVLCNPPSLKIKRKPARAPKAVSKPGQAHGWWKLIDEYEAGRVHSAVFVCFNMNVFQTAQKYDYPAPFHFPFCVPSARPKFWAPSRAPDEGSPSHPAAFVFLPPLAGGTIAQLNFEGSSIPAEACARFADAFASLGQVRL